MVDMKWRITVTLFSFSCMVFCAAGVEPGPVDLSQEQQATNVQEFLEHMQQQYIPPGTHIGAQVEVPNSELKQLLDMGETLLNRAEWKRTFVKIERAQVHELAQALSSYDVHINSIPSLKMLAIAGPTDAVDEVVELAKELDTGTKASPPPPPLFNNLEVVVHFLQAFSSAEDARVLLDRGSIKPEGIEGMPEVVAELKRLYGLEHFAVLESAAARVQVGSETFEIMGLLPSALENTTTHYSAQMKLGQIETSANDETRVRFVEVNVRTTAPYNSSPSEFSYRDFGFHSAFTVPFEKKVVIGKANLDNSLQPIFIVLEVRPLD